MEEAKLSTRRGALGRMLAVAFGAAGVGALAESKTGTAAQVEHGSTLTLKVPDLRLKAVGPQGATKLLPFGTVVDARGKPVGTLHTSSVDSTGAASAMQTFELDGGTIVGLGANGTYVVIGGTGEYAGVTGTYQERSAAHLPGRQFTFTFREGAHGSS